MAEWRPLHQQLSFRSGLEAGGQSFDPPLLPYEKSLIEAIGCTEEEYKTLVRHAMLRQRVRPAEYDHIPDVVNEPATLTAVAINLVVGALLTVASVLLAPKPPSFENIGDKNKKITGKRLADQVGPSRYNQSSSFDNSPSLAELNTPIPIPFGKKGFDGSGNTTGGLIFVPALVWSRIYAYGRYQAFEGVYVAGEAGVDAPDLNGILLGTSALSALGEREYAFYWSSKNNQGNGGPQGGNRLNTSKLLYGTQDGFDSGAAGRKKVFTAPAPNEAFSENFSMSYVPSGDMTFGTSTPIHNGTVYKLNWEVVSAPEAATQDEVAANEIRAKRRKIAGSHADVLHDTNPDAIEQRGMPGVGRAYSRRMGFIWHGRGGSGTQEPHKTTKQVQVGDTAIFEIYKDDYRWEELSRTTDVGFGGTEVNVKDVINSADGWRQRASDLLTIGSRWICGGSIWVVESRAEQTDILATHVQMKCVSVLAYDQLGIPGYVTNRGALAGDDGLKRLKDPNIFVDNFFFNLCKVNVATIRPVRRNAEIIEFGIRSTVWNKASGLCNFNALPSPAKLYQLDRANISLTTGRMDKYFQRSSCFNVYVRKVAGEGATPDSFQKINQVFCVQGSAPIAQNNYLRIQPEIVGYYEYRLIPRTGSEIVARANEFANVVVLQASEGMPHVGGHGQITVTAETEGLGAFYITTHGKTVQVRDILHNFEFYTTPPTAVTETSTLTRKAPTAIGGHAWSTDTGHTRLVPHAWVTHWLGDPANYDDGDLRSLDITKTKGDKEIVIRIQARVDDKLTIGKLKHAFLATHSEGYWWTDVNYGVVSSTGNWEVGERFTIQATMRGDNDYAVYAAGYDDETPGGEGYAKINWTFEVASVEDYETDVIDQSYGGGEGRVFEENSQISDCSYYEEVQKSNDSRPEHEVTYVNEYVVNNGLARYDDMSTVGFTVKSSGEIANIEQLRFCTYDGIKVENLRYGLRTVKINGPYSSNIFADLVYYLLTNKTQGVGNVVPAELIDKTSLETTADFLFHNQIFFDGVLEDSESIRGFLYDTAPLQLCTFTIKNGKFGMQPALPFYKTRHEDSDGNLIAIEGGKINSDTPLDIDQIFTAGNIIEDTLQVQYIDISQRSNIRAVVTWRVTQENDLPYQASALLYWADLDDANTTEQSFDLSEFCTNREQALKTARFLMSTRRRVTKTISFKTAPDALSVEPGSYIRVITEASTYNALSNGLIREGGQVAGFADVEPGTYDALLYGSASQEVIEAEIEITENESGFPVVEDERFHGYLFSLLTRETDYSAYQIDSLNLEEDGLVSISAVEVPTDENGHSIVAKDVLDKSDSIFRVIE